jgi:Tol biopolymer transport system component
MAGAPMLVLVQGVLAVGYGKIAFAGNYPTNQDIYVINSDGTGLTRLTDDPSMDRFPAYSWDGTRIAFTSARGTGGTDHICVMNAYGSDENCYMSIEGDSPAWSPDNTKLAFDWYDGSNRNIYIVNSNGLENNLYNGRSKKRCNGHLTV